MGIDDIEIRLIRDTDSIAELTDLLHRAYKPLADAGMRYFATHQTEDQTRERIAGGQCYIAILEGNVIGTVTLRFPAVYEGRHSSRWYSRPEVAKFGQFGVEPRLQGRGIGSRMLNQVERKARESGATELAFDTSENATPLIEYYSKRGFRFVEEIDHRPLVNYKSLIMSKPIVARNVSELQLGRDTIIREIQRVRVNQPTPILVALDVRSGSGKSVLASLIQEEIDIAPIQSDDFYAAHIPDAEWDRRTPEAKAKDAIDWRRLRAEALGPLLAGKSAKWRAFDFTAGPSADGTYPMRADHSERQSAAVIVLDGAYSTRPELADLIDLSVLIDTPTNVCHRRLADREEKSFLAAWHARWDAAEAHYFSLVRPPALFDLVVTTSAIGLV